MVLKRINVSFPREDYAFCQSRELKPSKLLQERVTQIRDEQNPSLIKNVKELHKKVNNFRKSYEYQQERAFKIVEWIAKSGKYTKEEVEEMLIKL